VGNQCSHGIFPLFFGDVSEGPELVRIRTLLLFQVWIKDNHLPIELQEFPSEFLEEVISAKSSPVTIGINQFISGNP